MLSNVEVQPKQKDAPPRLEKEFKEVRFKDGPRIPNPLASPQREPQNGDMTIKYMKGYAPAKATCKLNEFLPEYDLDRSLNGKLPNNRKGMTGL